MNPKITPFLWFDGQAEAAATFYVSIFENAKILDVSRNGEEGPGEAGSAMSVTFELDGQQFIALNGGPEYRFTPAVSFLIRCETQAEVDRFWDQLSEGGATNRCGWLTDKFGVTWQVVPNLLGELLGDEDENKSGAVMRAMLGMTKLDVAALQRAYDAA